MNLVILVVKNEKVAQTILGACHDRGAETRRLDSLAGALEALGPQAGDADPGAGALILDLAEFNTKSDKKINQSLAEISQRVKILGLGSGYGLKSVTSFFRSGLSDYLNLPLDPIDLTRALNKILGSLSREPAPGKARPARPAPVQAPAEPAAPVSPPPGQGASPRESDPASFASIVGQDPGLMEIFRIVEKVAATDSTVMVHGESGTGKELIARAIHQASPRRLRPMIPVNCGAIPEELLETELFGHEKGAFTNAIRDRVGRFEMADGGTIFLDEIGDMSAKLQVKLLRVIQEHEFERVGGDKTISVDIRIITATHVDLTKAVRDGRFREDLYYRLNVIPLTIPPLRERSGDVPLLIDYFLTRLRDTRGSKVTGLTDETKAILSAYRWPGNVRELENLMERMVILADGPILTKNDIPARLVTEVEALGPFPKPPGPREPRPEPPAPVGPLNHAHGANSRSPGPGDDDTGDLDEAVDHSAGPDFSNVASMLNPTGPDDRAAQSPPKARADEAQELIPVSLDPELVSMVEPILSFPESGVDLSSVVNRFEDRLIRAALAATNGVKNQAARALGLNRTTFLEKLKKKGIE
jgi:transcriptional regulator with GAF, ATPase, and Fis domain